MLKEIRSTRTTKAKPDAASLDVILYKLDDIHADVQKMQAEMTVLQEDFIKRRIVNKLLLTIGGGLIAFLGYLLDQINIVHRMLG